MCRDRNRPPGGRRHRPIARTQALPVLRWRNGCAPHSATLNASSTVVLGWQLVMGRRSGSATFPTPAPTAPAEIVAPADRGPTRHRTWNGADRGQHHVTVRAYRRQSSAPIAASRPRSAHAPDDGVSESRCRRNSLNSASMRSLCCVTLLSCGPTSQQPSDSLKALDLIQPAAWPAGRHARP